MEYVSVVDVLKAISFTALPDSGLYGASGAGVRIRVIDDLSIASVIAARGQAVAVSDICRTTFGICLIDGSVVSPGVPLSFVGIGPGKWLSFSTNHTVPVAQLRQHFGALAAVCDQSDAYVVFEIEGAHARECMMKGIAIDLDPRAFKVGDAATTIAAHIGLTFWQISESPAYRIAVARSYGPSFARHLLATAAEYGIDFLEPASVGQMIPWCGNS